MQNTLDDLQRLSARNAVAPERQRDYQTKIARLKERLRRLRTDHHRTTLLESFPRNQRSILDEVFNAIYERDKNLRQAQSLIETIVSRLKRTRRGSKSPKRAASR
jgi:uncharacterized coiled-coil protein SlyX